MRCPLFHGTADVDDVVGDHAEPDPTLHSGVALVSAAVETVPPLGHADASFAAGPPLLAVAEPALPLLTLALGTRHARISGILWCGGWCVPAASRAATRP